MREEHKQQLREARYKALYGDNWEEVMRLRAEHRKLDREKAKQQASSLALSKGEFLRLIAVRMRGFTASPKEFLGLAKLYAEVKKWTEPERGAQGTSVADAVAMLEKAGKDKQNGQ